MARQVYFDNNATTAVAPEVFEQMLPFFKELYGNPSSMHSFGGKVAQYIEKARESAAALINADPGEIVMTACGTESDNHAIRGILEAHPEKKHIVTTSVEHPAVLNLCKHLEKNGYRATILGVDPLGNLDLDRLRNVLTPDTAILSVMTANNETGTLFPIEKIGEIAREKGVIFHTDAV
ncbi:aminotransferase class V-fold PLP-dependent enzyme, partial [bacterium]|nr:aminotransferase class V-fold PLP-dependent enzyme [bacterium]